MRKFKIVLTILAIAALLSACDNSDDVVLFDDESMNADNRLEEILAALDKNDSDELENMFSKTTLSQVDNFQEQAEELFHLFEGTVKSWERTGFTSSSSIEDGKKPLKVLLGMMWQPTKWSIYFSQLNVLKIQSSLIISD